MFRWCSFSTAYFWFKSYFAPFCGWRSPFPFGWDEKRERCNKCARRPSCGMTQLDSCTTCYPHLFTHCRSRALEHLFSNKHQQAAAILGGSQNLLAAEGPRWSPTPDVGVAWMLEHSTRFPNRGARSPQTRGPGTVLVVTVHKWTSRPESPAISTRQPLFHDAGLLNQAVG